MTDIKRLADAMMRQDVRGIAKELYRWQECPVCEQIASVSLCNAPGCTAVLCPDCMPFHVSYHLEDDPKDQRPI